VHALRAWPFDLSIIPGESRMFSIQPHDNRLPRILGSAFLAACFLAAPLAHAAAAPDAGAKANRLMEASGMAHSIRQIQPTMTGSFDQPQEGLPDDIRIALRQAASLGFQPDPMIEKVRARLGALLTGRHLDNTLAWLESPVGHRITDLENASAEPAAASQIESYARELEKHAPSKRRVDLITQLMAATGSTEFSATMLESAFLATALGINAAQPAEQRSPVELVRQRIASVLPKMQKENERALAVSMHYTYRTLSDQELEAYLKFLKSASGTAYTKDALMAVREAMNEALARYMQEIPKALVRQAHSIGT
jgi:hypothetical protein